jgi:predicted PurR-regulated permease PerM
MTRPYQGPLWLCSSFLGIWLLLQAFPPLSHFIFLAFLSIVLAAAFSLPIEWFARRMPRPLAMLLTLFCLLLILAGVIWIAVPLFVHQFETIVQKAPGALERIQAWWKEHTGSEMFSGEGGSARLAQELRSKAGYLLSHALPIAFGTASAFIESLALVVTALFLAYQPETYLKGLLRLFPPAKENAVREVLAAMGKALQGWVWGTAISMAIIGGLTGLGLLLVGIENWFALAVLAGFGQVIPYLGTILSATPGLAVSLAESPHRALYALLVYLITHQLEGHLVRPLVMRKTIRIQPAVLILWQLAFSLGFGFIGLLVATPLLAAVQAAVGIGYVHRVLGWKDAVARTEPIGKDGQDPGPRGRPAHRRG